MVLKIESADQRLLQSTATLNRMPGSRLWQRIDGNSTKVRRNDTTKMLDFTLQFNFK